MTEATYGLIGLYIFSIIFFVVISVKCFFEKRSIIKGILVCILSPTAGYLTAFVISQGRGITSALDPSASQRDIFFSVGTEVGIQLGIQIVSMILYVKLMNAKNPSIAMFVYLCSIMIVPSFSYMLFAKNLIPVTCYFVLHIIFYRLIVMPLADLTKNRQVTNPKLFVVLPIFTYIYNSVMYGLFMWTVLLSSLSSETVSGLGELAKEVGPIEKAFPFLRHIINFIVGQYNLVVYPLIFVNLVLIIAFYVIIGNVKYTNELIGAKDEIKTLSVEVMEALAHTIDAKDEYTRGHSIRVAKYSRMIAVKMGLSEEMCENIYYMGLLHDIGKIGVPNEIINKPSKLTDYEYGVIKGHPMTGYEILAEIKSRPDLACGARWHHERYDGNGYPDHKKGLDIPLEARIIAVADSYDAMTSNRSYRDYLPQDVVREEISKNIGTQFDEAPAKAMLAIIDEDAEYVMHE